jgi:hypothetical protein
VKELNSAVGSRFPTVLRALLCLAALTLLAACASTAATADLPTPTHTPGATSLPAVFFFRQKEEPNAYMQALMEGDLVLVDDCLRIGGADGHVPIWPWDVALETDDSDVRVVGADGRVIAQVGDWLRISGGEAPAMPVVEDAARPLLANCPAPYWIVGNEIERVAERPGPSPSPNTPAAPAAETVALSPTPATPATPTPTPVSSRPPSLANAEGLIAFVDSEGRLYLIRPDGRNLRQVTASGKAFAPAWSPDGETLAYVYQEKAEEPRRAALYRLDTGQTKLAGAPEERLRSLAWSPNGRYLLLDSGTSIAGQIAIVEVASGQTVHESLTAVGFAWSPDGQRLALGQLQPLEDPISVEFGDSFSLAVLEVGAGASRVVLTDTSEVLYFPRAWLPDGRLLYDRLDWDEDAGTGEHSRWTVTVDGLVSTPEPAANVPPAFDREVTLARLPKAFREESTGSFSWSPDGRWLVFHTRLDREMEVYVFDWEQGGEPVRLIDGTSPAWRPAEVSQRPAVLSEGTLDCVPAGTFSHCVDDVLGIEFEVPASWGPIETGLRPGLDAGFAYDYYFDGKAHAETEPLAAGGRSADFAEARGAMPTDFGGYEHAGWQRTSACAGSGDWFSNSYPVCRQVNENVAWMIRFPNASVLCEDVLGNWQTLPVFRIEIGLPDNPTINGLVFEAPFFSEQFAGRVQNELYPLLGARLDWRASKCDASGREAFDAQLEALIETITNRTADAETLEKVDELVHLAESIRCQE